MAKSIRNLFITLIVAVIASNVSYYEVRAERAFTSKSEVESIDKKQSTGINGILNQIKPIHVVNLCLALIAIGFSLYVQLFIGLKEEKCQKLQNIWLWMIGI